MIILNSVPAFKHVALEREGRIGEKRILSVQSYRPDRPFTGFDLDLDPTVGQEEAEAMPVFGDVSESFTECRSKVFQSVSNQSA